MLKNAYLKLEELLCPTDNRTANSNKLRDVSMQICREFPDAVNEIYKKNQGEHPSDPISIKPGDDIDVAAAMLKNSFSKVSAGKMASALSAAQEQLSKLKDEKTFTVVVL